jgi:cobalt/nickel transport system permease protein
MNLQIDTLAYTNRLRHLPAEQKLIFALGALLIALITHFPAQFLIILWMGVWTVGYARIPAKIYLKLLVLASLFLLMSLPALLVNIVAVAQIHEVQADQWGGMNWGAWYVYISQSGVKQAWVVFWRSLACISSLFFLLCTVPLPELLQTMRRFGVPTILTDLLLLMYRFVFLLLKTAAELKLAQQARGGYRTWGRAMYSSSLLIGQLLQRTLQRYHQFSLGVAVRGFRGEFPVWYPPAYRYSRRYAIEAIVGYCGLLGLDWWTRV